MPKATFEKGPAGSSGEAEKLRKEIAVLIGQRAALTQQSQGASTLMQKLGKTYGFGVARKLEWADFKLKFKQEQLADCEQHNRHTMLAGNSSGLHLVAAVKEAAQHKMERTIAENPSELEPHIRRAYQLLIAAEQ